MSLAYFVEIGLTVLVIGAALGIWIYAAGGNTKPRAVMLLLDTELAPPRRRHDG
jgi:hypothetical protein